MGDENSTLSEAEARHLLRRTGFDVPSKTVSKWMAAQLTRGQAVDVLLKPKPQGFAPKGKDFDGLHDKWFKYLVKTKSTLPGRSFSRYSMRCASGCCR